MQETTRSPFNLTPIENVLLTRDYLARRKKAVDLISISRNEAKKITARAYEEAERITQEAQRQGFETGLLNCVDILARYLSSLDEIEQRFRATLIAEVADRLTRLLDDADLMTAIIEKWHGTHQSVTTETVTLRMHKNAAKLATEMAQRIGERLNISTELVLDDKDGCHVKAGEYVLEITPEQFSTATLRNVMSDVDNLNERFLQLSHATKQQLAERLDPTR